MSDGYIFYRIVSTSTATAQLQAPCTEQIEKQKYANYVIKFAFGVILQASGFPIYFFPDINKHSILRRESYSYTQYQITWMDKTA